MIFKLAENSLQFALPFVFGERLLSFLRLRRSNVFVGSLRNIFKIEEDPIVRRCELHKAK